MHILPSCISNFLTMAFLAPSFRILAAHMGRCSPRTQVRSFSFHASLVTEAKKYTSSHEWIDLDDSGTATFGYTKYYRESHLEIDDMEIAGPNPTTQVKKGDVLINMFSEKMYHEVVSPVSGTLVEVNTTLMDAAPSFHTVKDEEGWFGKILMKPEDQERETKDLLEEDQYQQIVDAERAQEQLDHEKWLATPHYYHVPTATWYHRKPDHL